MYTVFLVCLACFLICLACSLFALPCLHYLRFEPSGHWFKSRPRELSVFSFFAVCLRTMPYLALSSFLCTCLSGWMYTVYAFPCLLYVLPCLPYLAYITLDLNPANWAASVAQLAERNPVVTGLNPVLGSSVFFLFSLSAFGLCLTLPCLPLFHHVNF